MPGLIEQLADQPAAAAVGASASCRRTGTELVLHPLPALAIQDRRVLPGKLAPREPDLL